MKRNFTLIEVLVVIVIIAILAGMLVAVVGYVARRSDEVNTINTMQQFQAALDKFADANGYYPPSFKDAAGTTTSPKSIMLRSDADGNVEVMFFNSADVVVERPYFLLYQTRADNQKENFLQDMAVPNVDEWDDAMRLDDGWGNPIWYECPGKHNVAGYDMWSCGPNGESNPDDPRECGDVGEWICNWTVAR